MNLFQSQLERERDPSRAGTLDRRSSLQCNIHRSDGVYASLRLAPVVTPVGDNKENGIDFPTAFWISIIFSLFCLIFVTLLMGKSQRGSRSSVIFIGARDGRHAIFPG